MTKFENDALITLLQMKAKELRENPPSMDAELVAELAADVEKLRYALAAIKYVEK